MDSPPLVWLFQKSFKNPQIGRERKKENNKKKLVLEDVGFGASILIPHSLTLRQQKPPQGRGYTIHFPSSPSLPLSSIQTYHKGLENAAISHLPFHLLDSRYVFKLQKEVKQEILELMQIKSRQQDK